MSAQLSRFAARPVVTIVHELADALGWPRSRPARVLAGDRAATVSRIIICADEGALASFGGAEDTLALLASAPTTPGERAGRRAFDPFVGQGDDVATWRRAERVVLDAALPLAGGVGGVDVRLAERLGLVPLAGLSAIAPVRPVERDVDKFVGYVPTDSLDRVRDATFDAGAGHIGGYDRCSWSTTGEGTFRGGEGTNPAVGTRGEFERVAETRFEVVVPRARMSAVTRAFIAAHPYEEPAFDIVRLELPAPVGFGRIGRLGAGGGSAVWTALGEMDPELEVFGRADEVPAGAVCAVHGGSVRDILDQLLAEPELGLVVVGSATDRETDLLTARGVSVLVLNRARAIGAFQAEIAGMLTRALTLPVTAEAGLHFPDRDATPEPATMAGGVATSAQSEPSLDVFGSSPAAVTSVADPAVGTWRMHFDGGSRGNPGPAAYGWVLYDPNGEEASTDGVRVGTATNNVAEWTGLLRGLENAQAMGIRALDVRGDSELVVKQVNGQYKVKNAALKPLAEQVTAILRGFERVSVKHVYRTDNARADAVANEAMDGLR